MDNTRVTDGYSLMHEWDDFVCEMDVTADWGKAVCFRDILAGIPSVAE